MKVIAENEASQDLGNLVEEVWENHVPVIIRRENGHSAVVISLDEFKELDETAYLLSSPVNARNLRAAVEDCRKGLNLAEHDLVDP